MGEMRDNCKILVK